MSRRGKDEGASQGRPVIGRTGGEPAGDITPPQRELTSLKSSLTRKPWPTALGSKADLSAGHPPAGAAPDSVVNWHAIDWRKVYRSKRNSTLTTFSYQRSLVSGRP